MLKTCDFCVGDSDYAEGEKKSCHLFLSDTKLASRERAKLCFKAVRCKSSEGRFFPECGNFLKKNHFWILYAEVVTSHDAKTVLSLFIP